MSANTLTRVAIVGGARTPFAKAGTVFKKYSALDRKIVRIDGHISSRDDFIDQPKVLDGASDLFRKILGGKSGHARTVLGYSKLLKNATIELVVIAEIK